MSQKRWSFFSARSASATSAGQIAPSPPSVSHHLHLCQINFLLFSVWVTHEDHLHCMRKGTTGERHSVTSLDTQDSAQHLSPGNVSTCAELRSGLEQVLRLLCLLLTGLWIFCVHYIC